MNKKGQLQQLGLWIPVTMIMLVIAVFMFIFYDQAISQFLIDPLHNISKDIANNVGLGIGYNETLTSLKTTYDNRLIPYDFYFIFLFLIAFISTSMIASQSRKLGVFSFFGYIFMITMIFLLVMFFIGQFTDYFIINIFLPMFNDIVLDIPIITYFFNNINIIAFIWFMWLGLINQLDLLGIVKGSSILSGGVNKR